MELEALISKYARKNQDHSQNLWLKQEILKFADGEVKEVEMKCKNANTAQYFRRIAMQFLTENELELGVNVITHGDKVIIKKDY